jgi:integrase
MPYNLYRRPNSPYWWIDVSVGKKRIRRSSETTNKALAREKATTEEAKLFRAAWHGERRGDRPFAEAVVSYLKAEPRSPNHEARIRRLLQAMGDLPLAQVNQEKAIELKEKMLRPDTAPGTYTRAIVMPLRAVLNYAHELGWCDPPRILAPPENPGRTLFFLPHEVDRLIDAAAPHLPPLLTFLVGTGARIGSEALELDWQDVDLVGARAILWRTKGRKRRPRRNAQLPPRVVAALANLPHRDGPVFLGPHGQPYADRERRYGGQIKTAWAGALKRARLNPELTPHDLRHTWASWHYALHRDLLRLKEEGGWSSVTLVERYAHLLPAGHEAAIRAWLWHTAGTLADVDIAVSPSKALK